MVGAAIRRFTRTLIALVSWSAVMHTLLVFACLLADILHAVARPGTRRDTHGVSIAPPVSSDGGAAGDVVDVAVMAPR